MSKLSILIGFIALVVMAWAISIYFNNSQVSLPTNTGSAPPTATQNTPAVFAKNLDIPWGIAFLPDNRMLVTERSGQVMIINIKGQVETSPAAAMNVDTKPGGEGGLLGITLHPDFSNNHYVYLYYTYQSLGNNTFNRVVRMKFENDKLTNEEIIIDNIPGALNHNGGRIKFGPDGYLYVTTGDAGNPSKAQDTNSLAGKILRVTDEGKAVLGNPFRNLVYSYGHRNPQGIAWDKNGQLWETEHGRSSPSGFDEINLIQSGKNYGWPVVQGDETRDSLEAPKLHSGATTTWAPAGGVFAGNSFFFAGLRGQTLYEVVIENNQVVQIKKHLDGEYGRLREVVLGPDGMLYVTTSNRDGRGSPDPDDDQIIKVNPQTLTLSKT